MSDFQKRFVRVEWLATQKVVDLIREAGFDNTYYVGLSRLVSDEGQAIFLAELGRDLYDEHGKLVKTEGLCAEDFGLVEEIGELAQQSESDRNDEKYFLKRTYAFEICQKGERACYTSAWVSFAKRTEQDDWELVYECVTDQRRSGKDRWVIHRTDQKK